MILLTDECGFERKTVQGQPEPLEQEDCYH